MYNHHPLSCFIIGQGTLPIQCADILLQAKFDIYGIISADPTVSQWAVHHNLASYSPTADLPALMEQRPFDYLFSIVNSHVLSAKLLALPRQCAINYHDAPLPRYAGVYATSWAILNREKQHGITWHIITEQIDAGDILKQSIIEIAPDDTALTLNIKCYEAAIHAFAELVAGLAHHQVTPIPQNLAKRSYNSLYQRPHSGCVFSWNQKAAQIAALARALTFGTYPNYLGTPKFTAGQEFVITAELELLTSKSELPAGTITHIGQDSLTVSTADYDLALRKLLTIEGQPLSINNFVKQFNLRPGDKLDDPSSEIADYLTARYAQTCKHEAFWVERLAAWQPLEIPYLNHTVFSDNAAEIVTLPLSIPDEVLTFAAHHHWRLDGFLLSAFIAYLARLSDMDCLDIGFQPLTLSSELSSFFASHIPLRIEINFQQPFAQVYEAIQAQVNLTTHHQTYPKDMAVRYPGLQLPVFSAAVAQVETPATYCPSSEVGLAYVIPPDGSPGQWLYHPRRLDNDHAQRMISQFITFLRGLVACPENPLWQLPLLTEAERYQLLVEWNNTSTDYPRQSVHHLFEIQAAQSPNHVAVVYENKQLTYNELNQRSNQLAHYLQKLGVGPETLVGICLERSLEMMVGILGVLKAGGAYLPLDPAYPPERLAFMLKDSQARVLLTQQRLVELLIPQEARLICLDTDWPTMAAESIANPTGDVTLDNLAYVIYTSGSTGQPKGVMIEHRGLANYLNWAGQAYQVAAGQGAPVHSSISFDLTITSLFLPLLAGRAVTFLPDHQAGEALSNILRLKSDFSLIKITPAHLVALNHLLHAKKVAGKTRRFIIGGEALQGEHLTFWQKHAPQTKLINEYGPTETVVGCCVYEVSAGASISGEVPIGRPIANTQLYVLDRYLQPVPVGVPGELYIGGAGVARGYLNSPDLTAEKFITNPFTKDEGREARMKAEGEKMNFIPHPPSLRLYKTGDLARYLPDSNLEFLGRRDRQVKIRGFRIELGEIEALLRQHQAVREAIVTLQENSSDDKILTAYIVPRPAPEDSKSALYPNSTSAQATSQSQLIDFLQTRVPEYMLPSVFIFLETLPLTTNGKIDYPALPLPDKAVETGLTETYIAPRNATEEKLVNIWTDVLGVKRIGVYDNFFNLGGHSLVAVQVLAAVRDIFQVEIPLRSLFDAPTIADLAQHVETMRWLTQTASDMLKDKREEGVL